MGPGVCRAVLAERVMALVSDPPEGGVLAQTLAPQAPAVLGPRAGSQHGQPADPGRHPTGLILLDSQQHVAELFIFKCSNKIFARSKCPVMYTFTN